MLVPFAVVERRVVELVGETDVEALTAEQVVETVLEALHPNVALACSFQKEESVLLDMLLEREPAARVFALDTHVLFPETYAVWREIERRYGVAIQVYEGPSLGRQAAIHGEALWERNPDLCCSIRKIGPLGAALSGLAGWTDDDVWAYVQERDLPVNELHERGYASIGCTHCTAPGTGRDGRWAGGDKTECGLHA